MHKKSQVDLVLINPANRKRIYQSLSNTMSAIEPPVWAGLMATFVRRKGFSVAIIDCSADNLSPAETAQRVEALHPILTAIVVYGQQPSASTQVMPGASAVCNAIKALLPEQTVLMVGGHVAALPQRTLDEESADFVAGGEGLYTMVALIQALKAGDDRYENVPDLWYRVDGVARFTHPAPLFKELNGEMPAIAWDLLPMDKYRAHNWHCFDGLQREPYAAIYTTLGCPYHCSFCCIQAPFKSGEKAAGVKENINTYRFWDPKVVVDQIDVLVNQYGVRNIKIADEMFVLNHRHVAGICDLIIARGYDLNIWAYTRVDTIKENMMDKLKRAGVNWLAFGIEAASERVRDEVQKGIGQADIFAIIQKVQDAGIYVIGNYIFGLPEDDHTTMQETLDMALALNCEFGNFYSAMAYPGSDLYQTALREGWALPETWAGYSQHAVDTLPLPTKYLSAAEVLQFRDEAFQTYYTHQPYLEMIRKKFGDETVAHIREMAAHKLERKYV
ncbi:MAG: B12-binding domain-containing radical SAM protein [Caldilineaceae bacterium]|nr:B12-binding domain-containing radical SAM protein [Caldilineaceae bacterium]